MAAQLFTLNLDKFEYPLKARDAESRVIYGGADQQPRLPTPEIIENFVPTKNGVKSVGIEVPFVIGGVTLTTQDYQFIDVRKVYASDGSSGYMMRTAGKLYLSGNSSTWVEVATIPTSPTSVAVYFLNGVSWIFHPNLGWNTVGDNLDTLVPQTITGITPDTVVYAATAFGYNLAITQDTLHWSSPVDPTDFVPDPLTGAGATRIQAVKGVLTFILPIANGAIIYTSNNAVSIRYSGNPANPWVFREIANSSGVFSSNQVSWENNLNFHWAWTDNGLMQVTPDSATPAFPEVSDFLDDDTFALFVESQGWMAQLEGVTKDVRVNWVASRYLCISYGLLQATKQYILIFDSQLQRWGLVHREHVAVFDFIPPGLAGGVTYEDWNVAYEDEVRTYNQLAAVGYSPNFTPAAFGIMTKDTSVELVDMDTEDSSKLLDMNLIYRMELTRRRFSEVTRVNIDGRLTGQDDAVIRNASYYTSHQNPLAFLPSSTEVPPNWQESYKDTWQEKSWFIHSNAKVHYLWVQTKGSLHTLEVEMVAGGTA